MKTVLAFSVLLAVLVPRQSASAPATASAPDDIAALIRQLGSGEYAQREAAQAQLMKLRSSALEALAAHLSDPDAEVAARVDLILTSASGVDECAQVAVEFLQTGKEELVFKAATLVFRGGKDSLNPFRRIAAQRGGRAAIAAPIFIEQLESFVNYERDARKIQHNPKTFPQIAAAQPRNIEEQRASLAFVAADAAAEAIRIGHAPIPSSTPAARKPDDESKPPASQPGRSPKGHVLGEQ